MEEGIDCGAEGGGVAVGGAGTLAPPGVVASGVPSVGSARRTS
jgi:hypothetical protein